MQSLRLWAVTFDPDTIQHLDDLYQRALSLVDADSRARIQRYVRRQDAFRGLVGRLLPRLLLKERGVALQSMTFGATQTGKPYIITPTLDPPIAYNVSHDGGLVAMAFASGKDIHSDPPVYRLGVDVMKLQLPPHDETFSNFVGIFEEQLTALERGLLLPSPPLLLQEGLRRFYLIWTVKEAYTKALGLGLGFEFSRIEYDVVRDVVRIDGEIPHGWEFTRFELKQTDEEPYVGAVAAFVGGDAECVVHNRARGEWLKIYDGAELIRRAIEELR